MHALTSLQYEPDDVPRGRMSPGGTALLGLDVAGGIDIFCANEANLEAFTGYLEALAAEALTLVNLIAAHDNNQDAAA